MPVARHPGLVVVRPGLLAVQIVVACWAAIGGGHVTLGPLVLNPLTACWIVLWGLSHLSPERACGPVGEAFGTLGLLCHEPVMALTCFMPCLIENWQQPFAEHAGKAPQADRKSIKVHPEEWSTTPVRQQRHRGWRLGLLAPAACCLAAAAFFPSHGLETALITHDTGTGALSGVISSTVGVTPDTDTMLSTRLLPLAALALLPAFATMPVLAYSLIVPALLGQSGMFWPVGLVVLGSILSLLLPLQRVLSFWPLFLLGLTLSARVGGLADSALAGSEAFVLALALQGLRGKTGLLQSPVPPLAGFLPFWLGLHVVNGLTGLSPAWTAGGMILSLVIGVIMVRAWLASWQALSRMLQPVYGASHSTAGPTVRGTASLSGPFGLRDIPSLTLGLCLTICPGLLVGPIHDAALFIAGVPSDIWRAWPIWSIAGGDGAFWYPALVFLVPALIAPAFITHIPAISAPLPPWPTATLKLGLPWVTRRLLATGRRRVVLIRQVLLRQMRSDDVMSRPAGLFPLRPDMFLARHALVLWLLLIALALSWMGWTA